VAWVLLTHVKQVADNVSPTGDYLGLNNRKLKMWVAAIVSSHLICILLYVTLKLFIQAAGDCTKHKPPNTADFDGSRDGHLTECKSHGHTGPRSSASIPAPTPVSNDATALLMAALIPLITNQLAPKVTTSISTATPPTTLCKMKVVTTPFYPAPNAGLELHACLGDFLASKGIDLICAKTALMELELTPDIVSEVPIARLCEVMGAIEGWVYKFRVFCKECSAHLEEKKCINQSSLFYGKYP
jgi:hypothetical protein